MTKTQKELRCPQCSSERLYKDGLRYLKNGLTVQRWLCRNCGYRFTQPQRNNSDTSQHIQKVHTLILNSPKAERPSPQRRCKPWSKRKPELKSRLRGPQRKQQTSKEKSLHASGIWKSKATPRKQYAQQTARYASFNSEALTYWNPTQSKRLL